MQIWRVRGFETEQVHVLVVRGAKVMAVDGCRRRQSTSRGGSAPSDVVAGPLAPVTRLARCVVDAAVWTPDIWTAYRLLVAPVQQRRSPPTRCGASCWWPAAFDIDVRC